MKNPVPKSQIEILNQLIDEEQGTYPVRAGHRVHYVTIHTATFDEDTMCRPYLLILQPPGFPDADWATMRISWGADGVMESTLSYKPLPAIRKPWHHRRIDVLLLKYIKRHRSNVHEVLYEGRPAISKIALFECDFHRIGNETRVYSAIRKHQDQHPAELPCAPKFLGHLTENGRVIGFLLEKVEGEFASIDDLPKYKKILHRLHRMDLIHGDVNRYNFIVDRSNNKLRMIDFEHAEDFDQTKARRELESLASEFAEETGRGGPTSFMASRSLAVKVTPLNINGASGLVKKLTADLRPDWNGIYVYGARAYPMIKEREAGRAKRAFKTIPRGHIGYLVGYYASNIYRIWVPVLDQVIISRNVVFDEDILYTPEQEKEEGQPLSIIREIAEAIELQESELQDAGAL